MKAATPQTTTIREAREDDLARIREIYNQGIADGNATLDVEPKSEEEIALWFGQHRDGRYTVLVAERDGALAGWASLNPYSHRCAYAGVADLSVYVARESRGSGVGAGLLDAIDGVARRAGFHKIVLFALAENSAGNALYRKLGYRDVGVFAEQGRLGGRFVDVTIKEKLLHPSVLFVCRHNTGRSQMAEAFLRYFGGDSIEVASAGTIAADRPDPGVVAVMAEVGIDISRARPKLLSPSMLARAGRIITMGCDVDVPRLDDDWGLPDPKGQPLDRVREIREAVRAKAAQLAEMLAPSTPS
jgi:phosphinothricin acetyltransferase